MTFIQQKNLLLALERETNKLEHELDEVLPEDFEHKAFLRGKYVILTTIANSINGEK